MTVRILHGDCLEQMRLLPDESVHSVVTDPPYGLGFMGKAWDSDFEPGDSPMRRRNELDAVNAGMSRQGGRQRAGADYQKRQARDMRAFQEFCEAWARECLRVLKPGGHLLSFGGARTYHRMACAIEDAGFEIRDQIMWVYGCLDEATELVTPAGPTPYHQARIGDLALCYDASNAEYSYQPILDIVEYDYADTAYRLVGDFGEQVVSRNHRCLVERNGVEAFQPAETLQREARVPVLENLPALQRALSDAQQNASDSQQGLQPKVCGGANRKGEQWVDAVGRTEGPNRRLRGLPETGMEAGCMVAQGDAASVQLSVQRGTARSGVEDSRPQRTRQLAASVGSSAEGSNDWGDESGLEGWADLPQAERRLCRSADQVCALPDVDAWHGSRRWLRDAAPADSGAGDWPNPNSLRVSPSHQPRCDRQQAAKPDAVSNQRRAQGIRAWSGHQTALVRVVPFHYTGKVWCLRVPTGAFVAVRNGLAFPTGNSGFPKSLDVSKAIDRSAPRVGMFDAFAKHFAQQRAASGKTQKEIAALFPSKTGGLTGCVWNWENGANVPTREQWGILQPLLALSLEWLPLIERIEAERETIGKSAHRSGIGNGVIDHYTVGGTVAEHYDITAPATAAARQWQGWGTALKPAHEDIVVAQKPYDLHGLCGILAQKILGSICQLPLFAKGAESNSSLSQSVYGAAFDSVRWNAVGACNTPAALFDLMAMLPSELEIPSSLSTGLSWLATLNEISNRASTFTIETASSLTTDLRTLNCSPSKITPLCIIAAATRQSGIALSALLVANIFSAVRSRLEITRALSAQDPATSSDDRPALRPDHAPIVLARKPIQGTVAANVLAHGTGALNIDGCRVPAEGRPKVVAPGSGFGGRSSIDMGSGYQDGVTDLGRWPANLIHDGSDEVLAGFPDTGISAGGGLRNGDKFGAGWRSEPSSDGIGFGDSGSAARFFKECKWESESSDPPASNAGNQSGSCETPTAAEHAEQPIRQGQESLHFQDSTSESRSYTQTLSHAPAEQWGSTDTTQTTAIPCGLNGSAPPVIDGNINSARREAVAGASGLESATRFWYSPKASAEERNIGCEGLPTKVGGMVSNTSGQHITRRDGGAPGPRANHHPTVKPTDLMQYLVRLVTPPGGTVLDPFAGSGSTGLAADREGFDAILIEREAEYVEIARRRIVGDCPLFAELAA